LQANEENKLIGIMNDTFQGDSEEQAVYDAFLSYVRSGDPVGTLLVNTPIDSAIAGSDYSNYNTMNHKLMFVDHALSNNQPAVIDGTANYSSLGFAQNDEVFLIFRGTPLINKYFRSMALNSSQPPDSLVNAGDVQEINQLMAMWPFFGSKQVADGADFRNFMDISCGIIFGEITNYSPTVSIQNDDGTFDKIPIDVTFTVRGSTFFGNVDVPEAEPVVNGDIFVNDETLNPKHRYMLVVPAGNVTVKTIVLEGGQESDRFQPSEKSFYIGPGGVRHMNLQINPAGQQSGTTGGGGGGGAGA
jgi:hypothetical protein